MRAVILLCAHIGVLKAITHTHTTVIKVIKKAHLTSEANWELTLRVWLQTEQNYGHGFKIKAHGILTSLQ